MRPGKRSLHLTNNTQTVEQTEPDLRKFALSVGPAFIVVFGLLLPWVFNQPWPLWPWLLGGTLVLWGILHPASLGPLYRGWMLLGQLLHKIVSPIVLGLMFYLLFTPISLLVRLFGKRLIDTGFDKNLSTYRHVTTSTPRENYERPF